MTRQSKLGSGSVLLAAVLLSSATARAGVIWNESVNGDLSNSGLDPTVLTVSLGSNDLYGTTGKNSSTGVVDRDYFTFTVPSELELSSIIVLPGTHGIGPKAESFISVEAGPEVTVGTSPSSAAGLLGWYHYSASDIGIDILPLMGSAGFGSTGFTPPLPSGTYSFWVQEANVGTAPYGFDFVVRATPEPGSWMLLLAGLMLIGACIARPRGLAR
jgi:hypothetical protein